MSNVLQEDIERVINSDLPWKDLNNSTILITGANGLIGSNLVRTLRAVSEMLSLKINIIPYTRKEHGDIRAPINIKEKADYIFHCAAMTSSADMVGKPVDIILTALEGTRNVLEYARKMESKCVIYLSSMEVYGTVDKSEVSEWDLGYLDLSSPRSSYPESKRMCENLCEAYSRQYDVPVKIARLARTFGAGTPNNPDDNRVAMQFARCALKGEDIILRTTGNSIANCVYTADAIAALFTILFKGQYGHTYNVSADSAAILQMANMLGNEYGLKVAFELPDNIGNFGYAPPVGYTLNTDKIRGLGWSPKCNLLNMFKRMISDWRES